MKVEAHDGNAYQNQAEMIYNGSGQRLSLTAFAAGQSLTTTYVLDGNNLLAATSEGQTTYYLQGRAIIGEVKQTWTFNLADGLGTVRQVTDIQGHVTLARSFTPWGELLDQTGAGDATWGYLGGVLDAATGLIYVGSGQYYDPVTGRFLSRGANPGAVNPYVPWQGDPLGMLIGPLALVAVFGGKRKNGKNREYAVLLLVLLAASMFTLGMIPGEEKFPTPIPPTQPPGSSGDPVPGQPGGDRDVPYYVPPSKYWYPPNYCVTVPQPLSSLTPPQEDQTENEMKEYIESFGITLSGSWKGELLENLWEALFKIIGYQDLKLWLHGQEVTFDNEEISECNNGRESCYNGYTGNISITFYHKGQYNPIINFLHEFGHLFDNIWAGGSDKEYFTGMLKEVSFYDTEKEVIAGWDDKKNEYVSIMSKPLNVKALISTNVGGGSAWQQRGGTLHWEDWADIFANYVIDNINQNDYLGKQMYNFAYQMETLVFLGGYWKPCHTAH